MWSGIENNFQSIKTPRLLVRKYRISDAELLKSSVDKSIDHIKRWMPWADREPQNLSQKRELVRNFILKFEMNEDYFYAIFNHENTKLYGSSGLHTRLGSGILEIGYWIRVDEINKGLATEAAYALTKVGLVYLGAEKVEIRCEPDNLSSARVPEKLGYRKEYSLRSLNKDKNGKRIIHDAWTLFREEFQLLDQFEPIQIGQ